MRVRDPDVDIRQEGAAAPCGGEDRQGIPRPLLLEFGDLVDAGRKRGSACTNDAGTVAIAGVAEK